MTRTAIRFVDLTDRMIYLKSIPVGAMLPAPVLKVIAAELRERSFGAGEMLMTEGEPISGLHLLVEGRLSLARKGKPFGVLEPPQTLGFLGILARSDGTYDARAEVATRSLELDADTLSEILEDHAELMHATVQYLAERLLYEIQELPAEALSSRLAGDAPDVPARPLDLVERILYFRSLAAFQSTNLSALAAMASHTREVRYRPGTKIWSTGDASADALMVYAGTARCSSETGGDASAKTWTAGATTVLGGLEAIAHKPRWYALTAETDLVALELPLAAYSELLEDDFNLASDFIARLSSDLVGLLEKKAAEGKSTVSVARDVTKLGAVPVGA